MLQPAENPEPLISAFSFQPSVLVESSQLQPLRPRQENVRQVSSSPSHSLPPLKQISKDTNVKVSINFNLSEYFNYLLGNCPTGKSSGKYSIQDSSTNWISLE